MSQYTAGTVTVTNGSAVVTGSGTSWSTKATAGDVFSVKNSGIYYVVGSVDSDTQITLTANYAGVTASSQLYAISTSFTSIYAIPYPEQGDIDTATILKRAIADIESLFKQALSPPYEEVSSGTETMVVGDRGKVIKATGTCTIALPATSGLEDGWSFWLDPNGQTVTVDPNASETIDGGSTITPSTLVRVIKTGSGAWKSVG